MLSFSQYGTGYSIRTARYRYTEWGENGVDGKELYDHRSDAAEMNNLAENPEHAENVAKLSRQIRQRVAAARKKPDGVQQVHFENKRRVP